MNVYSTQTVTVQVWFSFWILFSPDVIWADQMSVICSNTATIQKWYHKYYLSRAVASVPSFSWSAWGHFANDQIQQGVLRVGLANCWTFDKACSGDCCIITLGRRSDQTSYWLNLCRAGEAHVPVVQQQLKTAKKRCPRSILYNSNVNPFTATMSFKNDQ